VIPKSKGLCRGKERCDSNDLFHDKTPEG